MVIPGIHTIHYNGILRRSSDLSYVEYHCNGSGVGLIADGRESCLKGLGFPNNGQHGIWWLRRFCSQVYSAERNEGRGATFRTGAVVTIKLDMDAGEAAFVVDGEELPYKARNIVGTVRPCVYAYGTGMRIQVDQPEP